MALSRIDAARRNVRVARYAIGVGAAAALAIFAAAARASHPATHRSLREGTSASSSAADQAQADQYGYFDGGYSIGPAGSAAPQLQSGAS